MIGIPARAPVWEADGETFHIDIDGKVTTVRGGVVVVEEDEKYMTDAAYLDVTYKMKDYRFDMGFYYGEDMEVLGSRIDFSMPTAMAYWR